MSRLVDDLIRAAGRSDKGLWTGRPGAMVRQTWGEVHGRGRRMSGGLANLGIGSGDAVAILASDPADIAPTIQAAWMRGASVTMLHQPTPRTDLAVWAQDTERVVAMIGARIVVLGAPFEATAPILVNLDIPFRFVSELTSAGEIEPIDASDRDVALLQLTSGSTGMPKAVSITHANLYFSCRAMEFASETDVQSDVMVSWLPLFHDMGMVGFMITPMFAGIEAVCVTPTDFLRNPLVWPRLVTEHGATMTAAPNFAFAVLASRLVTATDDAFDLSTLRFVLSGAEPIDPSTIAALTDAGARFGLDPASLVAAYGMAEATLGISFSIVGKPIECDIVDEAKFRADGRAEPSSGPGTHSVVMLGRPLPGIHVRVTDESGRSVEARRVGELEIRGRQVTDHYITPAGVLPALDEDGWLKTGDLGYLTETGELVVCDRKKDVIIVSGKNIYPSDIERAAESVDGVECAVAIRHATGETQEGFCVAIESRSRSDEAGVLRMQRLVSNRVFDAIGVSPASVTVLQLGALPKTSSGKRRRVDSGRLVRALHTDQ